MIESNPLFSLRDTTLDVLSEQRRLIVGHVMTVIDASVTDSKQAKAMKDVVMAGLPRIVSLDYTVREAIWNYGGTKENASKEEFFS